jgi:ATP-dependent protease Clp ATPase subunit
VVNVLIGIQFPVFKVPDVVVVFVTTCGLTLVTDDIAKLEFEMPIWICDAVELKETGTTIGLNP